jgi:hypothetical protein
MLLEGHMTPSELNAKISTIEEQLRSAITAGLSLICFAVAALAAGYGVHQLAEGTARTLAVIAGIGAAAALTVGLALRWRRAEVYEDVIVSGFRHVRPQQVRERAKKLVRPSRRLQIAEALDRLVDAARLDIPTPVPIHRDALCECEPQLRTIAGALRHVDIELRPAGIVLLRRLICDGATSPVFRLEAPPRELERQLAVIVSELNDPGSPNDGLALAA